MLEPRHVLSGGPLLITEFMASNGRTLTDGDGNFSDWIEIHNAGQSPVELVNHFLTDRPSNLQRWAFPSITIQPGEYLVVFASTPLDDSGNALSDYVDAGGNLHANFSLSAEGEYLALTYRQPARSPIQYASDVERPDTSMSALPSKMFQSAGVTWPSPVRSPNGVSGSTCAVSVDNRLDVT